MDLVFLSTEADVAEAKKLFPKNGFVLARKIKSDSDAAALKSLCEKTGLPGCFVLNRPDSLWLSRAIQQKFWVAVWPDSASALNLAVSSRSVDFVLLPVLGEKPMLDVQLFETARQSNVGFLFLAESLLRLASVDAIELHKSVSAWSRLAKKTKVFFQVVSGASKPLFVRSESDLIFFRDWLSA
ncbi:MAG: hypothetical protein J4215_04570 [Candidatus Diapherotrites archaeon]|uniref:Uncharacterized protein n=1 Tax=Candidatus Iainarchaeum sp. TaxID=3101447 RepID=A0A8T4L3C1_9ARCH|nr:hypothetical protein [Candidatus Diapherotrites archaeon]